MKRFISIITALIMSVSVSFSSFAGGFDYLYENLANPRTDWPREVADTPVVSVYNGMPENNMEGQFDMAGAIRAFEYAQSTRFPDKENTTLKAYVWDDTLAGFAQKMLLDNVNLGYDGVYVFDNTGHFDQSKVYGYHEYFSYYLAYPDAVNKSCIYRGKTVDDLNLAVGVDDDFGNPRRQYDYNMKVGAAILNHNGEKLLLFIVSAEGYFPIAEAMEYVNRAGGVDNSVNENSMTLDEYYNFASYLYTKV